MNETKIINTPINYGGIILKNRIIFAPTTMGLGKKEYFEKIRAIAKGGCAMIILGDVPVSNSKFGFSLFSKQGVAYYREIAEIVHAYDCKLCAQLHQSDSPMQKMFKYIPQMLTGKVKKSDFRTIMNKETGNYITEMPSEKIQAITASFGPAAKQAIKIGFDLIQIHGDRMCGSFSSTMFNQRQDIYGGTPENRARFALEAVKAVHNALPDMPIDYKLVVRQENPHYGNAGILESELPIFVKLLEEAGVTSFHVTLANHSKLEDVIPPIDHEDFSEEGCFLKFCDEVRALTTKPICGVGNLSHPDYVARQLNSKRIDCVAMSRQLIADPEWVNKVNVGNLENINYCHRCNKLCLGGMYNHKGVHCVYENEGK